jgi:hypothetical protein
MIGHYLLTLTPEQEGRVLTERLAYAPNYLRPDGCRCLIGVTLDAFRFEGETYTRFGEPDLNDADRATLGIQFDDLCKRFGETRINTAIRNRILANQARRALHNVREDDPHPIEAA